MTIKLCKLVKLSPVPLLVGEALFSNLGGTATMIGDPPNILIGNMLADYVNFNAFLINLAPGVLLSAPAVFGSASIYLLIKEGKQNQGTKLIET